MSILQVIRIITNNREKISPIWSLEDTQAALARIFQTSEAASRNRRRSHPDLETLDLAGLRRSLASERCLLRLNPPPFRFPSQNC